MTEFQFLIGSIGTICKALLRNDYWWFQFLIGSIGTRQPVSFWLLFAQVSIPYR